MSISNDTLAEIFLGMLSVNGQRQRPKPGRKIIMGVTNNRPLGPNINGPSNPLAPNLGRVAGPSSAPNINHVQDPLFGEDQSASFNHLPQHFPFIHADVVIQVAMHEFKPDDLCKLDTRLFRGRRWVVGTLLLDYFSLESLFRPLSTYFRILQTAAASTGDYARAYQVGYDGLRYYAQLQDFNEEYCWADVIHYHREFHRKRLGEMAVGDYSGWGRPDLALQIKYLTHHRLVNVVGGAVSGVL